MTGLIARLPEGRAGQALAVLAPLLLLLLLFFALLQPLLQWVGGRADRLAEGRQRIAHILALQAALPLLTQAADAAASASRDMRILLPGDSDAIAGADLQSLVTTLCGAPGVSLTSTAILPAQPAGSLRRIGIEVDLTAGWPALTQLLAAIETARPRMLVDRLSVSGGGATPPDQTSLQVDFSVSAFRAAGPP